MGIIRERKFSNAAKPLPALPKITGSSGTDKPVEAGAGPSGHRMEMARPIVIVGHPSGELPCLIVEKARDGGSLRHGTAKVMLGLAPEELNARMGSSFTVMGWLPSLLFN